MKSSIQMWKKISLAVFCMIFLSLRVTYAATRTWDGDGGNDNWSTDANWVEGTAPTSSDAPLFTNTDSPGTSILDGVGDWTVNGLSVKNPEGGDPVSDISHTLDLNGNLLIVDGDLNIANYASAQASREITTWTVTNGTLQVGSASVVKNLTVGNVAVTQFGTGYLVMDIGSILDGYFGIATIGNGDGGKGVLDLRNATTVKRGAETGVFRADSLLMGIGGAGQTPRYDNEILFGSSLTSLEVTSSLRIGDGHRTSAWIGKYGSDGTAVMPDNVDIKLGVDSANRATVIIANGGYFGVSAHLVAGSGGDFTGYLSTLTIGKKGSGGADSSYGRFDIHNMDSVYLNVSGASLIGNSYSAGKVGNGYVYLPDGTAVFADLTIGTSYGSGLLDLYGTDVTVNNSLTVNETGLVEVRVDSTGDALIIAPAATLALSGVINVTFESEPPVEGVLYGLQVSGDQRTTLLALNNAGKLTWDTTALTATAGIYYDSVNTYVALMETWPLTVIPKNLTVEVKSDVPTTLTFDIDDLDATPDDQGVTSRTITYVDDLTPGDPHVVTLPAITMNSGAASTNVSITLTLDKISEQASDDSVVTIIPIPAGTTDSLTWSGNASTLLMSRHGWEWGQNWSGGLPPQTVTPSILTFSNAGIGTNILDQSRMVGGLHILNAVGFHRFNLNNNTLTVSDSEMQVGDENFNTQTVFTNGTLSFNSADMIINSKNEQWSRLILQDVVLGGVIRTLRLGDYISSQQGYGELDLRDGTVENGLLYAGNLEVAFGVMRNNLGFPRGNLLVNSDTGLQDIVVTNAFRIADGHRVGIGRFGDPDNGYKLPPNVNITVGIDADTRGLLRVGVCSYGGADGYLATSSGGTMIAWLNEFNVGVGGIGEVNLTNMTSISIDAISLSVATTSPVSGDGKIYLPSGSLSVGTLDIGGNGSGLLDLYGTDTTVTNALTLGSGGTINVRPSEFGGGLSLTSDTVVTIDPAGIIYLNFDEATSQYGMLWEGDHISTLEGYISGGEIVIQGDYSTKVDLYKKVGDTYIGVPPPAGSIFIIE